MVSIPSPDLDSLEPNVRAVARAMALWWSWCPRVAVHQVLAQLGIRTASGKAFTKEGVKDAQDDLRGRGWMIEQPARQGHWRLRDDVRAALYGELLDGTPVATLRDALHAALRVDMRRSTYGWPVWERVPTAALIRLEYFSGAPLAEIEQLARRVAGVHPWQDILNEACFQAFDAALFERIEIVSRWELASIATRAVCAYWRAGFVPVASWALGRVEADPAAAPAHLRLQLAEWALHRGEEDRVVALLQGIDTGEADALRAACLVHAGRWQEAQAAFEAAFKKRQVESKSRRRLLPTFLAFQYPLALIARQTADELERARKFCLGESGSRSPAIWDGWGLWVHAIAVRLGDTALKADVLELRSRTGGAVDANDLWRCLLRAWLGAGSLGLPQPGRSPGKRRDDAIAALRAVLHGCGLVWLEQQVVAAEATFRGEEPAPGSFLAGRRESWRESLGLLESLGEREAGPKDRRADRLLWSLEVDRRGRVVAIEPLEQQRGTRGWNKPKAVSLTKLASSTDLEPQDARVVQALRKELGYARRYCLDRAEAIDALIGHPAVVLSDAPDTPVDVVAGVPELEVAREGDRFVMRMSPLPHDDAKADALLSYASADERREADALKSIVVVRDSPQRVRVIRISPAQRRAAQLIAGGLAVPVAGEAELQRALEIAGRPLSRAIGSCRSGARSDRRGEVAGGAVTGGRGPVAAAGRGAARAGGPPVDARGRPGTGDGHGRRRDDQRGPRSRERADAARRGAGRPAVSRSSQRARRSSANGWSTIRNERWGWSSSCRRCRPSKRSTGRAAKRCAWSPSIARGSPSGFAASATGFVWTGA